MVGEMSSNIAIIKWINNCLFFPNYYHPSPERYDCKSGGDYCHNSFLDYSGQIPPRPHPNQGHKMMHHQFDILLTKTVQKFHQYNDHKQNNLIGDFG